MNFERVVTIAYKDVFGKSGKIDVPTLIQGIPSRPILRLVTTSTMHIHLRENDQKTQFDLLGVWLANIGKITSDQIVKAAHRIASKSSFVFIRNASSLIFYEYIFSNFTHGDRDLTPAEELKVLQAYMLCSEKWTVKQEVFLKANYSPKKKIRTPEKLTQVFLPVTLPYFGVASFKNFIIQSIKAFYFFKYAEEGEELTELLNQFLQDKNVNNWQEYISNVLSAYLRNKDGFLPPTLEVKDQYSVLKGWLSNLCIDLKSFAPHSDFRYLRQYPIFRYDHDKFMFLNQNFIIDKIFQAIKFDFANTAIQGDFIVKGVKIKNRPDYFSFHDEYFTEKVLTYYVLEFLFSKVKCKKYRGEYLKKKLGNGEPDYYIRQGNCIYLIESKGVFFKGAAKHSYDFNIIYDEIEKKLIRNQQGNPKGILQLLNNIQRFDKEEFRKFDKISPYKKKIFPIIIVTDATFNVDGLNYLLSRKFQEEIAKIKFQHFFEVFSPVVIHIDTLIKFQDLIRSGGLSLWQSQENRND